MKYAFTLCTFAMLGVFLIPSMSYAATCTTTYDFNLNGYNASGTVRTVNDTAYGSFTVYNYPYGSPTTLYDVYIETEGSHADNNGKCYTQAEMDTAFTWAFDQGIGLFFAQDDGDAWVHDLSASCGNTNIFTRTVASTQPAGPSGGDPICDAGFHIINRSQNRAAHQAECQALGSGWDLATVTSSNATAVNAKMTGFAVVANRVLNASDFEYPYKCGIETTWPEPLKTLIYNGSCFADIPDTTVYSKALCVDSTPLCNTTDGVCNAARNTCTAGTFSDLNDSANEYKWECLGIDEGDDSPVCTAPIPEDEQDNGNDDAEEPVCASNRPAIVGVGSEPSVILSINLDEPTNKFDWTISGTLFEDIGPDYTVVTTNPVSFTDISVDIRHDNGNGTGGPVDVALTCPAVIVVNPPEAYIDKPIVEATETCTLRWDNVDSSATCIIKNQEGTIIHTIPSGSVTGTHSVDPTDPNNKYFVECEYAESDGSVIGSIHSEYVSCIKKGQLQEI